MTDSTTIVLINESKRAWSLPSRAVPGDKGKSKLGERGKPKTVGLGELERVETFRPPLLEVGGRIEVPDWYFDDIKKLPSLRPVWNRKVDGIAVGRTRAEQTQALISAREDEAKAAASQLAAAMARITKLERESAALADAKAKLEQELAAKSDPKTDPAKTDPAKTDPAKTDPRGSRNG